MERKPNFPANAETMNAIVDAMGALVMALLPTLSPAQREAFAGNLSRLASIAEASGQSTLETLLIDLQSAARM